MKLALRVFVITLIVLFSSTAGATGSIAPAGRRVIVSLSAPPITRVRVSFDHVSGRHLEVNFDPAKSDGLIRNLYLDGAATGTAGWSLSVSADPIVLSSSSSTHFLSLIFGPDAGAPYDLAKYDPAGTVKLVGAFKDAFGDKGEGKIPQQTYTLTVKSAAPEVAANLKATAAPAVPSVVGAGRSADPISGVVDELLRVIAEIAVDRARSRGLALLTNQIKEAVCTKLAWSPELARALHRPSDLSGPLLPRTCRALDGLRLEELAASVKVIQPELVGDLSALALGTVEDALTSIAVRIGGGKLANEVQGVLQSPDCPSFIKPQLTKLAFELRSSQPSFARVEEAIRELMFLVLDAEALGRTLEEGSAAADFASARFPLKRAAVILARHPELVAASSSTTRKRFNELAAMLSDPNRSEHDIWASVRYAAAAYSDELPLAAKQKLEQQLAKLDKSDADAFAVFKTVAMNERHAIGPVPDRNLLRSMWEVAAARPEDRALILLERGPELLKALRRSSSDWEMLAAEVRPLTVMLKTIARILPDLIAGRSLDEAGAQRLLLELQKEKLSSKICGGADDRACAWACGVDAALMVIATCQQADARACSAAEIETQLDGLKGEDDCKSFRESWPELPATIAAGAEALHPRPDASRRESIEKALTFGFDVLERRACGTPSDACVYVQDMRGLVRGIIDEDTPRILLSASSLVTHGLERASADASAQSQRAALKKTLAVAGAITAYTATYASSDAKNDAEKTKQLHDARKKAIEGLIDATTQRADRRNAFVLSLGVNPGFVVSGYQRIPQATNESQYMPPQLSLPMGLAFQKLPDTTDEGPWKIGHHLQLAAADLGQFVAIAEDGSVSRPRWDSFLMAGIQYGVIVGTPSNNFMFGVDARWSPTVFTKDGDAFAGGGALRAGGFVAYYVPFFDLN